MDITSLSHQELLQLARTNVADFANNSTWYEANEAQYLQNLYDIATKGRIKMSRPGQPTISLAGTHAEYDLTGNKIPLLRSKQIFIRTQLIENQWFASGSDEVSFLKERNVSIWDSWVKPETAVFEATEKQTGFDIETYIRCHIPLAFRELVTYKQQRAISIPTAAQMTEFIAHANQNFEMDEKDRSILNNIPKVRLVGGNIGAGAYGPAWRRWEDTRVVSMEIGDDPAFTARGFEYHDSLLVEDEDVYNRVIDQLGDAVKMLRNGADSRRIIISAWNAAKIDEVALPPCHSWFQFVSYDNFDGGPRDLVCILMQRSNDAPVGKPTNIAQYAALTHLMAKITNHRAVKLIHNTGDDHIYADQIPLLAEQFNRPPINKPCATIEYPDHIKEIEDYIAMTPDELSAMIKGYEEGSYHPRINYPVAV